MQEKRVYWQELDILRGIAVTLMLTNHLAVRFFSAPEFSSPLVRIFSFIGSFAPVVFFFVTGLGYGLSYKSGVKRPYAPVIRKFLILFAADIFLRMRWTPRLMGWDFLAFIGMSMLILQVLRNRKHPLIYAIITASILFLLRYALWVVFDEPDSFTIEVITGLRELGDISYWFTPWLIFPLFGFGLGIIVKPHGTRIQSHPFLSASVLLVGIAVSLGCSLVLQYKGFEYFRWGIMSINFFIASFACIFLSLTISLGAAHAIPWPKVIAGVSLRGVSSLVIVPIHYILLDAATLFLPGSYYWTFYLPSLIVLLTISFLLAKGVDRHVKGMCNSAKSRSVMMVLIAVTALSFILCLLFLGSWRTLFPAFTGMLSLCYLLGFEYAGR